MTNPARTSHVRTVYTPNGEPVQYVVKGDPSQIDTLNVQFWENAYNQGDTGLLDALEGAGSMLYGLGKAIAKSVIFVVCLPLTLIGALFNMCSGASAESDKHVFQNTRVYNTFDENWELMDTKSYV